MDEENVTLYVPNISTAAACIRGPVGGVLIATVRHLSAGVHMHRMVSN